MAKQSGLGDQLFISGVDIGADVMSISSLSTPREMLPGTNITQSAQARLVGKRDATAEFTAYFNDATGETHDTLKALPVTDVHLMYLRGQGYGKAALALVGKQIDYAGTRGDDGQFTFSVNCSSTLYGADWGQQLTNGKATIAAAGNLTGVDLGVYAASGAKAFGYQAYLQVFSIGSGTPTVKLQGSSDDAVGDPYADITDGSFGAVTAPGVYRIQSSSDTLSVEQWARVTTTGTFTNLVCSVVICRNEGTRAI